MNSKAPVYGPAATAPYSGVKKVCAAARLERAGLSAGGGRTDGRGFLENIPGPAPVSAEIWCVERFGFFMNEYPNNGFGQERSPDQDPQSGSAPSGNDWIYSQPNQNAEESPDGQDMGGGCDPAARPGEYQNAPAYGWDPYYGQPGAQGGAPYPGQAPQPGYAYMQGLGFVEELPELKEKRKIRQAVTASSLTAVLFSVLSGLLVVPMVLLFQLFTDQVYYDLQNGPVVTTQLMSSVLSNLIYVISLLTCSALLFFVLRRPFSMKKLFQVPKAAPAALSIPIFLGVTVVASGVIGVLQEVLSRLHVMPVTPDFTAPEGDTAAFMVFTLCMTLLPAFLEEFFFRGIIMTSLRRYGDTLALIVSSLLFALVHGNFVQSVNAFILALAIGYFVMRTGSLWTGILLHLLNNVIATLTPLLLSGLSQQTGELVSLIIEAVFLLAGIAGMVVFALKDKHAFRLIDRSGALTVGQRLKTGLLSAGFIIAAVYYMVEIVTNFEVIR